MRFISENNLAALLGTSAATVHNWSRKNLYPTITDDNGHVGFDMAALDELPEIREMNNSNWDEEMTTTPLRVYNSVELFAGGGGLALGLDKAGLHHVLLNEFETAACNTLRTNRPQWNVIEGDVRHIDFSPLRGKIDFLSGGFPCQAFSFAGKQGGFDDVRGTLFFELARAVREIQPKVFMGENVKGLVSHDDGRTFATICNVISELGYVLVPPRVIKAMMYQVPQKRERIILIAIRKDLADQVSFSWPTPYKEILTLKDALFKSVIFDNEVPSSEGTSYPPKKQKVLELVPQGGDWRDLPEEVAMEYMGGSWFLGGGKTGMARRLSLDEPSLTLTCSPAQKQTERCHPLETRPLTVREYARIQTFPDEWVFQGTMSDKYKQIGNAVPVNMAWAIGRSIVRLLNDIERIAPEQTADCTNAVRSICEEQSKLIVIKDRKNQTSIVSNCKQLNLFSLWEEWTDNPIVEHTIQDADSYYTKSELGWGQQTSPQILIGYIKPSRNSLFEGQNADIYWSGKRFPSSVRLNELKCFVPYIKGKGIRDLYMIKCIRIGTNSGGKPEEDPKDLRLVFEVKFVKQLFEDYTNYNLDIWRTYSFISSQTLCKWSEVGNVC